MKFLKKFMSKSKREKEEREKKFKEDIESCNKEILATLQKHDLIFDLFMEYRRNGVIPNLGFLRKSEVEEQQRKIQEERTK